MCIFSGVQEHLSSREDLAATVSALFMPPSLSTPRPFGDYGNQVIVLAPEISTVGWLPEVEPGTRRRSAPRADRSGRRTTALHRTGRLQVDPANLGRPIYPIVDIAPERNRKRARRRCRRVSGPARRDPAGARYAQSCAHVSAAACAVRRATMRCCFTVRSSRKTGSSSASSDLDTRSNALFQHRADPIRRASAISAFACNTENVDTPLYVMDGDTGAASRPASARGHRYRPQPGIRRPPLTFTYFVAAQPPDEAFRRGLWNFLAGLALTARRRVISGADRQPRGRARARSRLAPLGGGTPEGPDSRTQPSRPQRHVGRAGGGALELHVRVEPRRCAEDLRRPAAGARQCDVAADRERLEEREFPQPDHRRDLSVLRADQDQRARHRVEGALGADIRVAAARACDQCGEARRVLGRRAEK